MAWSRPPETGSRQPLLRLYVLSVLKYHSFHFRYTRPTYFHAHLTLLCNTRRTGAFGGIEGILSYILRMGRMMAILSVIKNGRYHAIWLLSLDPGRSLPDLCAEKMGASIRSIAGSVGLRPRRLAGSCGATAASAACALFRRSDLPRPAAAQDDPGAVVTCRGEVAAPLVAGADFRPACPQSDGGQHRAEYRSELRG